MKKAASFILIWLVSALILSGCVQQDAPREQSQQTVAIANPWVSWDTLEEAEAAVGFSFGLPEVIADSYQASEISTMNRELIQVVYRDGTFEVCVRKKAGEGQDISGDYNQYESRSESAYNGGTIINYHNSSDHRVKQLVSYQGYSWSLVAPSGYWGDSNYDFISKIWEQ